MDKALLGSLLEGKHRQKSSFPESNHRFNCEMNTNVSETNKGINDHIGNYHCNASLSDAPPPLETHQQAGRVEGLAGDEVELLDEGALGHLSEVLSFFIHGTVVMFSTWRWGGVVGNRSLWLRFGNNPFLPQYLLTGDYFGNVLGRYFRGNFRGNFRKRIIRDIRLSSTR